MTLFQLLLITGVVHFVLSAPRKYYLIQTKKTWQDAQDYCRATHTDLAVIESTDNLIEFQKEAQKQGFNSEAWIGLYNDINSWRWSFNNESLGFEFWRPGQPNNYAGHEECAVASSSGWLDKSCNNLESVVCFDARSTATDRYIYISEQMSWYDAQSYCRLYYTDLAIIKGYTESVAVGNMLYFNSWIGLFRDSWKWINGTNKSTIRWRPGQPDNMLQNEDCAFVSNGQASDAPCSATKSFFCYSEMTGRKQTVRVKVQSKENINDPAVKAAILENIKEKLMDNEMAEDTTVKWIEQPGGEVFHKEECNNNGTENKTGLRLNCTA